MTFMEMPMPSKLMTQVKLKRDDGAGVASMICWIEADKRIKKGSRLTLKDHTKPDDWWEVDAVYETMERNPLHQKWDAGGITARHYE